MITLHFFTLIFIVLVILQLLFDRKVWEEEMGREWRENIKIVQ